jgi:hypothetical protein
MHYLGGLQARPRDGNFKVGQSGDPLADPARKSSVILTSVYATLEGSTN